LTLSNPGPGLAALSNTLIHARGARHNAETPEGIASGEDLHIALDDFTPPVASADARGARLEIRAAGLADALAIRLP
jgi:hypothetical protein